jgi:hypothetical protein
VAEERTWPRAAGLLFITLVFSVSTSPGVLVAFPFLALTMVFGLRSVSAMSVAMFSLLVAVGAPARGGLWYLERGWALVLAGCFVVLTMQWPRTRFFPRAFAAVTATAVLAGLLLIVRPGSWPMVDWLITESLMQSISVITQMFSAIDSEVPLSTAQLNSLYRFAAQQERYFPALLGLSSLSGLGVAWWAYARLSFGGVLGLGPLRDFRFNDHFMWLFLIGLALIVFGAGEGWANAGSNAVVFMGGLYALRGAAVLVFFSGGLMGPGILFLAIGMLVLPPVLIMGALVVGVGDTWLDLRSKAAAIAGDKL